MKLPRWLTVILLSASVLAVLGAGAWWWVTWPEALASQFCELVGDRRFDDASRMCDENLTRVLNSCEGNAEVLKVHAGMRDTRNVRDVFLGRYGLDLFLGTRDRSVTLFVTAERGKIVIIPNE
jgi:hypothetical protein